MPMLSSSLRYALMGDAAASGATGFLTLGAGHVLAPWLGLPAVLLQTAGLVLIPYALIVALLARRETISRPAVWAVIAINALWAVDSVALLMSGPVSPTALGIAFVLAQAIVVAGFAAWQYFGLRQTGEAQVAAA